MPDVGRCGGNPAIDLDNVKRRKQLLQAWPLMKRLTRQDLRPDDATYPMFPIARQLDDRRLTVEQPIDDDVRVEERLGQESEFVVRRAVFPHRALIFDRVANIGATFPITGPASNPVIAGLSFKILPDRLANLGGAGLPLTLGLCVELRDMVVGNVYERPHDISI